MQLQTMLPDGRRTYRLRKICATVKNAIAMAFSLLPRYAESQTIQNGWLAVRLHVPEVTYRNDGQDSSPSSWCEGF